MRPEVTVLMPAYNAALYLADAVESVLAQTFRDFELVVVDDGSTDETPALLASYAARDPRVRLTCKPFNDWYTNAIRDAFQLARGEFIARMDSDDVCMPNRLTEQVCYLREHPECVLVGTRAIAIDKYGLEGEPFLDGPTVHEELDAWHMSGRGARIVHPSVMFRHSAFEKLGGYRHEYEPAEDFDLWLRMAEVGQLAVLPNLLLHYRVHLQSVSKTRAQQQNVGMWRALADAVKRRKYSLARVPFSELSNDEQIDWINLAILIGRCREAREWATQRIVMHPSWRTWKQWVKAMSGPALPYLGWLRRSQDFTDLAKRQK